jgi:hypothetical protein
MRYLLQSSILMPATCACVIYGECHPQACQVFPIGQKNIDEISACGKKCGYHFADK